MISLASVVGALTLTGYDTGFTKVTGLFRPSLIGIVVIDFDRILSNTR